MIHPHTYIHPNARLATNVKVDPFTVIHQDVEIGDGTWVGSNVTIMEGARIGKNCRIFPGAVIAAIPQDLKFHGEYSTAAYSAGSTAWSGDEPIRACLERNDAAWRAAGWFYGRLAWCIPFDWVGGWIRTSVRKFYRPTLSAGPQPKLKGLSLDLNNGINVQG